jgi:poly(3-hydroxybutyrate) depolymerase
LTTPFENVLFDPDIAEQGSQALAERLGFLRLAPDGLAQNLAHLLFNAPTMSRYRDLKTLLSVRGTARPSAA